MMELSIIELTELNKELLIIFKKSAGYINKKYEGHKCLFDYKFFISDNNIILYFVSNITGGFNSISDKMVIQEDYDRIVVGNMPGNVSINGCKYHVYLISSLLPSKNDIMFEIISNSYKILIPTSIGCGLNLMDFDRTANPIYDLSIFMKDNMVWWWRRDDGPNTCDTEDDDCSMIQYAASIIDYL